MAVNGPPYSLYKQNIHRFPKVRDRPLFHKEVLRYSTKKRFPYADAPFSRSHTIPKKRRPIDYTFSRSREWSFSRSLAKSDRFCLPRMKSDRLPYSKSELTNEELRLRPLSRRKGYSFPDPGEGRSLSDTTVKKRSPITAKPHNSLEPLDKREPLC